MTMAVTWKGPWESPGERFMKNWAWLILGSICMKRLLSGERMDRFEGSGYLLVEFLKGFWSVWYIKKDDHFLVYWRVLFILWALTFQIIFVFVTGAILLKCLKNPLGMSSYVSWRFFWIWHSDCSMIFIILFAFSSMSAVKVNSFEKSLFKFIWMFPTSKLCALMATFP